MKLLLVLIAVASAFPWSFKKKEPQVEMVSDVDLGTIEMLSYECRILPLNETGDVIPPSQDTITGPSVVISPAQNQRINASSYDWENTRSIFWDYPQKHMKLEFYTGAKKYATVTAPSKGWDFDIICGFQTTLNEGDQDTKIEIEPEVLKELDGRIFQSKASYALIVATKE